MSEVQQASLGSDHRQIKSAIEKLDHVTAEFAKRVMDRGIERALKGHSVGEFEGKLGAHAEKAYSALQDD